MFHYNAQHTGYNDSDNISPPLHLKWVKKFQDDPLEEVTIVGDYLIVVSHDFSYQQQPDPAVRCLDASSGEEIWKHSVGYYEAADMTQACIAFGRSGCSSLESFWKLSNCL